MTDAEIKAVVEREQRTDRAERTLSLTGADITYVHEARSWTRNAGQKTERRWQVQHVRLTWDLGKLRSVHAWGQRYKQDGTVGQIKESTSWKVVDLDGGGVKVAEDEYHRTPVPGWLVALVAEHSATVPEFRSMYHVGA